MQEVQLKNVPLLVFANKQDLSGSLEPGEIAEGLSLFSLRSRAWQIEGAQPNTGVGMVWSGARQRTKTGINVVQQVLILGSSLSHPMYRMFCQGWHRVRPWHELDAAANHNEVNEDCRWCEGWCERLHDFSGAYETGVLYESSLVKLQTLKIQTECICQNTSFRAPQ